jgi:hypothetical protein
LGLVFMCNGHCRTVHLHDLRGRKQNVAGEMTRSKLEMYIERRGS